MSVSSQYIIGNDLNGLAYATFVIDVLVDDRTITDAVDLIEAHIMANSGGVSLPPADKTAMANDVTQIETTYDALASEGEKREFMILLPLWSTQLETLVRTEASWDGKFLGV